MWTLGCDCDKTSEAEEQPLEVWDKPRCKPYPYKRTNEEGTGISRGVSPRGLE